MMSYRIRDLCRRYEDADSIVSVLEVLETMDEDGVVVSEDEFSEMMASLNSNTEYDPL